MTRVDEQGNLLATPANMRALASRPGPRAVAYDAATGERYSADAGDYWWMPDGAPLRSALDNEPLILARVIPETVEPIPEAFVYTEAEGD